MEGNRITVTDKNQLLHMLVAFTIKEYEVENEIHVSTGGSLSAYDYFEILCELGRLGHISDVMLRAKSNFNVDFVKTIEFIPKKSLKEFELSGGFKPE